MKIFRSILGVTIGVVVAFAVIIGAETINSIVYKPDDGRSLLEWSAEIQKDKKAMKAWIESVPQTAMVVVLLAWQLGAFFGGGLSALIAGRARLVHAGIIGVLVLASTVANSYMMKKECDISHPDWMIVGALLMPIPISLLGGKVVSMMFPPSPVIAP